MQVRNKERAPQTEAERAERAEKQKQKLDKELMIYTAKAGGNTEIFEKAEQSALDAQLRSYMEKAKDAPADEAPQSPKATAEGADAEDLELR